MRTAIQPANPLKQRKLDWETFTDAQVEREVFLCALSCSYFINQYVSIFDAEATGWIPFDLWREQEQLLDTVLENQLTIALKARQLGITWLALAIITWLSLFRPKQVCLIFSKRDDEAIYLLGDERLSGMIRELPSWLKPTIVTDSAHQLSFANGSIIYAFPTTAGDSYTATFVLIDEADLVPDLNRLMRSVKPTMEAGGKMFMISRVDKNKPNSEFKNIYRASKERLNAWANRFLPWWVRPGRTQEWYENEKQEILTRTGSLDDLHEQYPATDIEALSSRTLGKRIAPIWVDQCYVEVHSIVDVGPAIPELVIYAEPAPKRLYVIGGDPAEGNPTSDDSAASVLDVETGEEVAVLKGKFQPSTFAANIDQIGTFFNRASVMVERNNHGHAVLLWLKDHSRLKRLTGHDEKEGWNSNTRGKALLYDSGADAFRDVDTTIHTFETALQIKSIEGATLRAPEGDLDDLSDSYMLAVVGRKEALRLAGQSKEIDFW